MTTIIFNPNIHSWNPYQRVFTMSEKEIPFDTSYEILNQKTGGKMSFEFSHSTGSEFSPDTKWIYYNADKTVTLEVCNDPRMTKIAAENYLKAKTMC
jgi:hypothetical protein